MRKFLILCGPNPDAVQCVHCPFCSYTRLTVDSCRDFGSYSSKITTHPPQHNRSRSGGVIWCKKLRLLRVKMSAYYKINNLNLVLQNSLSYGQIVLKAIACLPPSHCQNGCVSSLKLWLFYLPLRLNF